MLTDTKNTRIPLWDNLKFILIFLVVLGHVADRYTADWMYARELFMFIYSFHMPAFIFVSGLFCKKAIDNRNYNALFSYLVLYLVTKITVGVASSLGSGHIRFSLISEGGVPWYAFALFLFCLVTMLLRRFNPVYIFVLSIALGCFVGVDNSLGDLFVLTRTAVYYPFFFAGYCLDADRIVKSVKKPPLISAAFAVLAGLGVLIFFKIKDIYDFRPLLTGRNPFSALGEYAYYGVPLRLAYYPLVFLLIACVIAVTPSKRIPFISVFGSRTAQVYALHVLVINAAFYLFKLNPVITGLRPSAALAVIVLISLAVTLLCSVKIFSKPFSLVLHPPLRKE